jgi:YD repeat-containing protein
LYARSQYTRDASRERVSRIDELSSSTDYTYDTLGQLIAAEVATGPFTRPYTFSYDVHGNRISRSYFGNTTTWTYDAWNQIQRMTPGPAAAWQQEQMFDTLRALAAPRDEQGGAR